MGANNRTRLAAMLAVTFLCVCATPAAAAAAPSAGATPLAAYGRLPSLENVAISPDGTRVAFVRTQGNDRLLAVVGLSDAKPLAGLKVGDAKLRDIDWADDDHLLITTSTTTLPWGLIGERHEYSQLMIFEISSRKMQQVPKLEGDINLMNVLSGRVMVRHLNGHTVLFIPGIWVSDVTLPALIKYDVATGSQHVVREGTLATRDWLVDDEGAVVAQTEYLEREKKWQLSIRLDGHLKVVASDHSAIEYPDILGFGPSGDSVLVEFTDKGNPVWKFVSLKDGTFTDPTAEQRAPDFPLHDPVTHRMIGGVTLRDSHRYVFFERARQDKWESICQTFDTDRIEIASVSGDFNRVIVKLDGPDGLVYKLIDLSTHRAYPFGNVYDGVEKPLEVRRIDYAAADGFKISAYLTLPEGRQPKNLPLVVMPHGGPESRDSADFDWWAQAVASQGYAVLQPNFRGSNMNWETISAGFGEWGRKMQTDLSDGVRHLAKDGIIDATRVCIVGASYGGYAALAGVTLDPGVYRCAISVAGISDLKQFVNWINQESYQSHWTERYLDRYLGITGPRDPALEAISPIKHIDKVDVPVLLIHGRDDTVVPYDQSDMMLSALKHANKKVEMVTMKKEDHWLSRSETRLLMLQSSMDFLRANNPPD